MTAMDEGSSTKGVVAAGNGHAASPTSRRRGEQIRLLDQALFDEGPDGDLADRSGPQPVPHLRRLATVDAGETSLRALRRDAIYRRSLAAADLLGAVCALVAAQALAVSGQFPLSVYLGIPLVVVVSKLMGLYDRDELVIGRTSLAETPALFKLATFCTLLVVLLASAAPGPGLRAAGVLALWALLFLAILGARNIARRIDRSRTSPERCLVLGEPEQASRIRDKLASHASLHAEIAAFVPFEGFELRRPRESDFGSYVTGRGIDRVIVAPSNSRDRVLETVAYFKEQDLKVSVMPDVLEVLGSSVVFDEIHGTMLLGVRSFGLSRSSALLKRGLDVSASVVLFLLLAPLVAAIALAVRLTSPGPIFFRQTRVGRDGERFTMLKFRTMLRGSEVLRDTLGERNETDGLFKLADDPRVTRVGRFLRRTSLDELPQLFNVLRGEMSLVGPRPLVVDEDAKVEGWHRRRLHLKPGMTGAWQIMGHTRVPLQEMVSMDYLYIVNWSLWSDVRILLQTIDHVFGQRNL